MWPVERACQGSYFISKKKKKGTLLEFYQGARIKLTAAFCFVFKDLPFRAPPGTRGDATASRGQQPLLQEKIKPFPSPRARFKRGHF